VKKKSGLRLETAGRIFVLLWVKLAGNIPENAG
jgi:hypothetical protein